MKLPDVKQIQLAMRSGGGVDWSESEESLRAKVTRSSKVKSGRTDHGLDGNSLSELRTEQPRYKNSWIVV